MGSLQKPSHRKTSSPHPVLFNFKMMKYTLALLALGLAASVASADKPVYSAKPATPAQHTASVNGGPSNNERWDENGSDDFTYSPPPTTHFESQPQPVYQSHANFESQPAIQTSYHDVGPSYTTQSYRYQPHHQQQLSVGSPFGISQIISTGLSILATVFILSSIALFIKNMWPKVMAHFGHGRSLQVDEIAEITGLMLDAYNRFTEHEE